MGQENKFQVKTQKACLVCKGSKIIEEFEREEFRVPIPPMQRVLGPSSGRRNSQTIFSLASRYYCSKCGVVFMSTPANKLEEGHREREQEAREKLGM